MTSHNLTDRRPTSTGDPVDVATRLLGPGDPLTEVINFLMTFESTEHTVDDLAIVEVDGHRYLAIRGRATQEGQ